MGHRVVVVEDEPDLRYLVGLTLGFDDRLEVCGSAGTGEEALRAVEEQHPELIVLDHWLRGPLTGLEVAEQLRAGDDSPLIVLFTASDVAHRDGLVDAVVLKEDIHTLSDVVASMLG